MSALRPCRIVIGTQGIYLFFALLALAAAGLIRGDTERLEFLGTDKLISHHVGTSYFEPTLGGVILARNQLDDELRLSVSWTVAGTVLVQVIAHHAMFHLCHIHVVEGGGGIVADTRFEPFRGSQVHVLRISHRGAIYDEVVCKGLVDMLVHFCRPDTVTVTLHSNGLAENLTSQLDLFGIWCLHTEDDAVVFIFR